MTRTPTIASRLREVFLDGLWIANTNYKHQLENTGLEQAIQKVGSLNTIAALTYHINYYLEGLLQVMNGGPLDISDKYSFDVPAIYCEEDWKQLVARLLGNADAFVTKVRAMPDAQLDEPFVNEKYGTWLRNIEGVIEHSYYHLGQISLIRKMVG